MSMTNSGKKAHDDACNLSEMTRQSAVAAAFGNQATIRTLEITHYRACLASALANNVEGGAFRDALKTLGTGGV